MHHDVLEDIDDGVERMNARVIGREMRAIVAENSSLEKRVNKIVAKHIADGQNSKFIEIVARQMNFSLDDVIQVMQSLKTGFEEIN